MRLMKDKLKKRDLIETDAILPAKLDKSKMEMDLLLDKATDVHYLYKDFKKGKRQLFILFFLMGMSAGSIITTLIYMLIYGGIL